MKRLLMLLAAAVVSFNAQAGGDATRGATLVKTCTACHGADFNKPIDPSYPKLAGQHPDYLEHALHAYKRGDAPNGRVNPDHGRAGGRLVRQGHGRHRRLPLQACPARSPPATGRQSPKSEPLLLGGMIRCFPGGAGQKRDATPILIILAPR